LAKRLSIDDREKIDLMDKEGYKPQEIAAKIGKDTRTIKRYLDERPRENVSDLERQQQELDHRNDIRTLIINFKEKLKFPLPEVLDITDLSIGYRAYDIGGQLIGWQKDKDGSYNVKFEDDFNPVIEHLQSSRRIQTLKMLTELQAIGGKYIVNCHNLRVAIQQEAEKQTKLKTIPETITVGNIIKSNAIEGLLEGFSWTIYRWSLSQDKEQEYIAKDVINDLRVLHYGMYNLAHCVDDDEVKRIINIHQKLIRYYRKVSTTIEILEGKKKLDLLAESTCQKLDEFASLKMLPGKCHLCPGD
jgi:hypothetical protein